RGRPGSSAPQRRFDGGDVDLLHRHHRGEGALRLTATSRKRLGERARGDLPGQAPAVLAPTALALLAAIADDRVPVAVRLFLGGRGDLEGEGLAVPELRAAVETETGNAQNGELHRQDIALLAARVVTGGLVHSNHFTIRKGGGVEARRLMRVLVEPEADRVLGLHTCVLLVLVRRRRRTPACLCKSWTANWVEFGAPAAVAMGLALRSSPVRRLALAIVGTVLAVSRVSAHPTPFSYVDVKIGERQVDVVLVAHTFDVAHELAAQPPELLLDPKQLAARGDEIVARLLPRLGLVADGHALSCRPSPTPEALPDRSALRLRLTCDVDGPAGVLQVRAAL